MTGRKDDVQRIARAFVDARRGGSALAYYPGTAPADLSEAYRIQDAAIALDGRDVRGWKLGRINAPDDTRLGASRLAGPIFAGTISRDDDALLPVIADGFAAAEAEFLIELGTDADPAKAEWSVGEAMALCRSVHIGIEIASSPYPGINRDGPAVTASDFGNNHGLLIGSAIPDWRTRDLNAIAVSTWINGAAVGAATTATMLDGPWGSLRFLLELMHRRGISLRRGQWVSTGAVTGVHPVRPGDRVEARFDDRHIACRITAATPFGARESDHVERADSDG